MTRETDKDVSDLLPNGSDTRHRRDVHGRAKFINESNGDLFVSIHVNSCEDPYTRGAITFFSENNPQSEALAEIIQSYLNAVTKAEPQAGEYFHEKTRAGDFYILLHTDIPGVIVEVGFITSPRDKNLLATDSYRKKLAEAICAGIDSYIRLAPDSITVHSETCIHLDLSLIHIFSFKPLHFRKYCRKTNLFWKFRHSPGNFNTQLFTSEAA